MLRKRGKKCVYTLPRINPRAANLNSTEDAQKLGREIQDDVMEILHYAFNPIPEGEEDRIKVCYNGSDIPGDNMRRKKTNQLPHRPQQHNQSKHRPKRRQTTPHGELRHKGTT